MLPVTRRRRHWISRLSNPMVLAVLPCGLRDGAPCGRNSTPSIIIYSGVRHFRTPPSFFNRCTEQVAEKNMQDPLAKIKQKLLEEIDQLSHELNVDLPKEIAVARAHGDLSENAEYKYAKERQGFVNARIGQLKARLGDLGMLNLTNIPKDRAGYGSRLTVLDIQRDIKIEYKLVSTEEADAEHGLISTTPPTCKKLLQRKDRH